MVSDTSDTTISTLSQSAAVQTVREKKDTIALLFKGIQQVECFLV